MSLLPQATLHSDSEHLQSNFRMIPLLHTTYLKSVKQLHSVQNYFLVMNTQISFDSPVANTSGSQLLGVFGSNIRTYLQKNLSGDK